MTTVRGCESGGGLGDGNASEVARFEDSGGVTGQLRTRFSLLSMRCLAFDSGVPG